MSFTGTGSPSRRLTRDGRRATVARDAASVVGVDVSASAVAHAQQRYPRSNLRFVAASVTALPLPDASIDLVVSFETIEHLAAQAPMLAEFRRSRIIP